ncbi:PAS domain-containing protein [Methanogenium organophilum]|uniref:PAS domain-containing protein n=1 Tax=Methanogenium organophilum TaxID=2199 RepID=A0A9X9S210_METOG|nr:PAS domain-containing protein [Methanogenium organophilum]WAI00377.1 PAS domain-containing protein [Methanogenium organophilum]
MMKSSGDIVFTMLEYLPVGVCIIDSDYTVHFWNSCMEQWTGRRKNELTGNDLRNYFSALKQDRLKHRLENIFTGSNTPVILSSQIHTYIFDAPLPGGAMRRQHTTVLPIEQPSGHYAMFVCEDVTSLTDEIQACREMKNTALCELEKREKAEYNLRVANEDLLAYVSEATVRLKTPVSLIEENLREILNQTNGGNCDTEEMKTILKLQIQVASTVVENLRELSEAIIAGKKEIPTAYRNMIHE